MVRMILLQTLEYSYILIRSKVLLNQNLLLNRMHRQMSTLGTWISYLIELTTNAFHTFFERFPERNEFQLLPKRCKLERFPGEGLSINQAVRRIDGIISCYTLFPAYNQAGFADPYCILDKSLTGKVLCNRSMQLEINLVL